MIGIIKKRYANLSQKKEKHPVHDVLGTDLYNVAKTIVHKSSDKSDNLSKNSF